MIGWLIRSLLRIVIIILVTLSVTLPETYSVIIKLQILGVNRVSSRWQQKKLFMMKSFSAELEYDPVHRSGLEVSGWME